MKNNVTTIALFRMILFASCLFDWSSQQTARMLNKRRGDTCGKRSDFEPERKCVYASDCRPLIEQIKRPDFSNNFDFCSFEGKKPIICCPTTTTTLDEPLPSTENANSISTVDEKCRQYIDLIKRKSKDKKDEDAEFSIFVVGGLKAKKNEFPHMALLGYGRTAADGEWGCGGSLISENWILTAAHCLQLGSSRASWARLGVISMRDEGGQDVRIVQHVVHPDYRQPSRYNDIALFRLERNVEFSDSIKPICLNANYSPIPETQTVTGWGRIETAGPTSDDLLKVDLMVVPADQCNSSYFSNLSQKNLEFGITPDSMICAGSSDGDKDACLGDSGGPLQTHNEDASGMRTGLYTQFGVISFGRFCGDKDAPGVYTRVSKYTSWIENIVWPVSRARRS